MKHRGCAKGKWWLAPNNPGRTQTRDPPPRTSKHSRTGVSPRPPGLPEEGLHTFPGVGPCCLCPGMGMRVGRVILLCQ